MRAIVCPYCREVVLFEGFCRHASMVHDVTVPLEMTEEQVKGRFMHLGGVIFGELTEKGKFLPNLA